MPFLVEDGTIVAGANALASVAFADDYFSLRGIVLWAALSVGAKQSALVNATDYIQIRYGHRLIGSIADPDQSLAFPRIYSVGGDPLMPDAALKATCEYALRASERALQPDPILGDDGRMPIKVVEEIGPIREEYAYSTESSKGSALRSYPAADALIATLLLRSSGVVRA